MTFVEDVEIRSNSADSLKSKVANASSDFVDLLKMLKEVEQVAVSIRRLCG